MSSQVLLPDLHLPVLRLAGVPQESPLPLESTLITGQVTGPVVAFSVEQRFRNPFHEPVELEYLFPLAHTAAVSDFELVTGGRRIQGKLEELKQAQERYEQARQEGRRAGLLEQRRPNLFSVQLANILPGENITATLRYQDQLAYRDGEYELVIPMGLTPRYHSPANHGEQAGVDAPLTTETEKVGPVEVFLSVAAGTPAGEPVSPSHRLNVQRLNAQRFNLRLADRTLPDHDFVLRYGVAHEDVALAAWRSPAKDGDFFLATLLPPALEFAPPTPPREFIFVLDRSGSMMGEPIAQARNALRACLRALNPQDTFRILLFDDRLEWYRDVPAPVTQAAVDQADSYLESVEGRGGTEIIPALQAALGLPVDAERMRLVVFLTDGAVSAEARALDAVRSGLGAARLFTFGIGPSVNRALLSSLASLGRGAAEFLGLDEDIEGAILRFQDRVSFPVITDLQLEWQGAQAWDVYPARLPDLYAGQPLEVAARLRVGGDAPARLVLNGRRQGQLLSMALDLPAPLPEPAIARLWAHRRIDDLLEQQSAGDKATRTEVIGLALEHNLATPFTAFVAVDSNPAVSDGKPQKVDISQPLPPGLNLEGFTGPQSTFAAMAAPMGAPPPSPRRFSAKLASYDKSGSGFGLPGRSMPSATPPASADSFSAPFSQAPLSAPMPPEAEETDRDIPTFLRNRKSAPSGAEVGKPASVAFEPAAVLRQLARTQALDGSWAQDAELTAAALLAFVRQGHTARLGNYRQQVRRAFAWLAQNAVSGQAAWLRAVALAELAAADGLQEQRSAAEAARQLLPAPQGEREQTVDDLFRNPPGVIPANLLPLQNLDDLLLAAICGAARPAQVPTIAGRFELVQALLAALK